MLTQFELVMIITVALMIQVLIFTSRSTLPKKPQHYQLN